MGVIRHIINALLVASIILMASCNATRVVKPLEKGEKQLSASIGGPGIIYSGAPMPLPLSSVSYAHGLDTGITLTAGLHTTSAAFGVLQADIGLGISAFRSKSDRFGVTVSPSLNLMYEFSEDNGRTYPQVELLSWWQYSEKPNLLYGGVSTWIELVKTRAHGQVQENEFMPWVTLGHQFNRAKWSYLTEVKYLGLQHNTGSVVVDYISPADQGVLGFYVGISRKF